MQTFVIFRKAGANRIAGKPTREQPFWDEHAEYTDRLFEAGKILLAGPYDDGSGALIIVRVENEHEAQTMFDNDPWVIEDILDRGEVKGWQIFLNAYQP